MGRDASNPQLLTALACASCVIQVQYFNDLLACLCCVGKAEMLASTAVAPMRHMRELQATWGAHRAVLGLEPRLTREGTEEALLLRREPFLLRAEPLLLSMESLLLRAEARPDREDLPESIFPDNAFPDSAFPASGGAQGALAGQASYLAARGPAQVPFSMLAHPGADLNEIARCCEIGRGNRRQ